jgi:hypothetical protein
LLLPGPKSNPLTDSTSNDPFYGIARLLMVLAVLACDGRSPASETQAPPASNGSTGTGAPLAMRPFPDDNAWNQRIVDAPIDPNSATLIASCGRVGLHADFGTIFAGAPNGIPYVVVSGTQPRVPVTFRYAGESDAGPYPIPPDAPVEGGSQGTGDRHILIVDKDNWRLYELFSAFPVNGGTSWRADAGAVFDLNSNVLRPAGWTSADAAGLPILPGLVRYDEAAITGEIRHALRFTCPATRRAYVHPARHYASSRTDVSLPPMGMRVRLRAGYDVSSFPPEVRVILNALKRYGMFLADTGSAWFISGAPDARWSDENLSALRRVQSSEFEVVRMGDVVTP